MNRGVEILLARMDSNPEEFRTLGSGRWTWAINGNKPDFLEVEEWDMLQAKLQTLRAEEYAQAVMRELLTDTPNTVQSTFLGLQQTLHTTFLDLQQTLHKQSKERS
jgi:spermidine synthase